MPVRSVRILASSSSVMTYAAVVGMKRHWYRWTKSGPKSRRATEGAGYRSSASHSMSGRASGREIEKVCWSYLVIPV